MKLAKLLLSSWTAVSDAKMGDKSRLPRVEGGFLQHATVSLRNTRGLWAASKASVQTAACGCIKGRCAYVCCRAIPRLALCHSSWCLEAAFALHVQMHAACSSLADCNGQAISARYYLATTWMALTASLCRKEPGSFFASANTLKSDVRKCKSTD